MYGALDISTSALVAQRIRLDVIAANIANQRTILNENDEYEPYRRRTVVFSEGDPARGRTEGVHVASIEIDYGPLNQKYEPGSPFADADGYVSYPNVNSVIETMNAMDAARAYEANITAIEATKSMLSAALKIIA
ncbi:MAG: flagellar basal body rod protein FlgC [Planctomycetes bacterium]|nr:flagellar basal body rod protein FlgC [Planctomycetota bacterium]